MDAALLIISLADLALAKHTIHAISYAATHSSKQLNIILLSELFEDKALNHAQYWAQIHRMLTLAYVEASKVAHTMDKVLLDVNIMLKHPHEDYGLPTDKIFIVAGDHVASNYLPQSLLNVPRETIPNVEFPTPPPSSNIVPSPTETNSPSIFPVVAIGGTFDHLHAGHKILLSMASWITQEKLIVGLTDDVLLANKSHKHVLEDFPTRKVRVSEFLGLFKPGIEQDIVPINDVYGPTGWDPNIQAIVVSKETLRGADAIASHRKAQNLPALKTFIIDVISPDSPALDHEDEAELKQAKMSSTFIRQWIVSNSPSPPPLS